MISSFRARIQSVLLAFAAVLLTSGAAFADNYTLTTRVKPTEAVFDGKTYTQLGSTDLIDVTASNAQLWLTAGATLNCNVKISGNGYGSEKTGKIRMDSAGSYIFNGTVDFSGNTTIASNVWQSTKGTLYFNGQLTGAAGLIVAPGYQSPIHLGNLSSTNNYQGNTQIGSSGVYNNSGVTTYAGTIILDADEQIPDVLTAGSAAKGNLVLYSWSDASSRLTSTLNLNGHTETVNGLVSSDNLSVVTGTSGSKLIVGANNDTSTYSGNLQGEMQLEKTGTGTLTLSKAPAHTGSTTVTAGTLELSAGGTLNNLSGAGAVDIGENALTLNNSSDSEFSGVISGSGAVTKTGSGTQTLSGANTYTGATTISSGSLILSGESAALASPDVTIQADGVFQTGASVSNTNVVINGGSFTVGDTPNSANITTQSLTLNSGAINFDLNDSTIANDYDKIQTGAISSSSGNINLSFNYGDESAWWNAIGADGVSLISCSSLSDISSIQVTVNGAATSSWGLSARDNSIYLVAAGSAPEASKYWYANNPSDSSAESWTIDGTSKEGIKLLAGNDAVTFSKPVIMSGAGSIEVAEDYNLTLSGQVSGAGAMEKTGKGTLTLSGANSLSGAKTISDGSVKMTNASAFGTGAATIASGATLEIATNSSSNWTWNVGTISGEGTLKVTNDDLTIPFANLNLGSNGKIIADGSKLTIDNKQNATVYYTSGTDIDINNGGSVTFKRSGSNDQIWLRNNPVITFDSVGGGKFNTGDSSSYTLNFVNDSDTKFVTTGGAKNIIAGNNGFNLHSHNLTFDVAKGTDANCVDLEVSAKLWNGNGIVKDGLGTMALTYPNEYKGPTTINAGTLLLSGSGKMGVGNGANNSSMVTIASGATLKLADNLTQTTIINPITGSGNIVKDGTYAINFNGTFNSFAGNMTINGGKVSLLANGGITYQLKNLSGSGDLELRLAGSTSGSGTSLTSLTNSGFTGYISLVQEGSANGNKIATSGSTYQGFKFKVNNGTSIYIYYGDFNADSYISGNGNYENRGALRIASSVSGKITVMADANIGFDGNNTVSGAISSGAASGESTLFINGKTDGTTVTANRTAGTLSGAVSDGNSGSKLGIRIVSNTITFSGDLSYTGATTVNSGATMNLSGSNANLVNSRTVTLNGKLDYSNYSGTNVMQLNDLSGTTAASEIIGTNKNLILNNNNNTSYAGKLRIGNGIVTASGTGTLTLTGKDAALYSGGITVNSSIASTADQTFHNLSGSGDIAFSNDANLTLTSSAPSTYSGTITGVNALTVQQNGAYDLSGASVSVANFETKDGASVSVSSEKPMTVTNSFRQGNAANFTISGGSATISGDNVAQQATIALNGGTMSINSYNYTAPTLPNITSLALHLDASDASSFDNSSSIGTWKNLANPSNSLTFTNIRGNVKASVTPNVKAGLDVVTFPTSGGAYYDLASVINGRTYFAVITDNGYTSSSQNSFLFANKGDSAIDGHNPYCYHRGNGTVLWNTTHLDANIKNGVTSLNGTAVPYASADLGTDWNVLSIQTTGTVPLSAISRERNNSNIPARGWRGDIAEILVYTEALTEEQYQAVSQYLATKWQVGNDIVEPTVVTTGAFVSTNAINVVADSTIDVAEFSSVTFGSTTIDEGKTLTINVAEGQETVWTSPISGAGSLTKTGNGTLFFSETPTTTGSTTVESGTLTLPEGGTLYNLSGGSLNPDGTIAQSAAVDATGKNLTLINTEKTKFIGSITANDIVTQGEGTLQIYTGAEGQVDVQSLTVSSDRVDLKGYMSGSVIVKSGSVFSPGNSVGEATIGESFTLENAATLLMEQDATGMDKLTAQSFEINPNSILELTLGAAIPGATYEIIVQKDGDNPVNFVDDLATDDFWNSLLTEESAYYWNLSVKNNVVYANLDANAVPEPSTWALLALGVVVLFLRKRVRS